MSAEDEPPSPHPTQPADSPTEMGQPSPETVFRIAPGGGAAHDPTAVALPASAPPPAPYSGAPTDLYSGAPPKRRGRTGIVAISAIVLLVAVGVITAVLTAPSSSTSPKTPPASPRASESLTQKLAGVPESVFESVGLPAEITNYPQKVSGLPPLTDPGLPELLWMGAGYCPFCGAERWSLVMALSRFGTFSGLGTSYSSPTDFAPNTPTLDFSHVSYTSRYLVFRHYELATNRPAASSSACNVNGYACLQIPPDSYITLFQTIGGSNFPFLDFGNVMKQSGAAFVDQPLVLAGLTFDQIASQVYVPTSAVAQAEDGSANYITAAICIMTGNKPASVCSTSVVQTAETQENTSTG